MLLLVKVAPQDVGQPSGKQELQGRECSDRVVVLLPLLLKVSFLSSPSLLRHWVINTVRLNTIIIDICVVLSILSILLSTFYFFSYEVMNKISFKFFSAMALHFSA